ncbi:MAG: hypothetical protein WCO06_01535 [Candidatus Roizmanbacteria bacterium]
MSTPTGERYSQDEVNKAFGYAPGTNTGAPATHINAPTSSSSGGSAFNDTKNQTSPTVVSNANKINDVPKINAKQDALNSGGLKSDTTSGATTYANNTIFNPKDTTAEGTQTFNGNTYKVDSQGRPYGNPITTSGTTGGTTGGTSGGTTPTPETNPTNTGEGGYYGGVYIAPGAPMPTDKNGNPVHLTPTTPEQDSFRQDMLNLKASMDATGASNIDNINKTFDALVQNQQEINTASTAGVTNALIMSGSAQHDPYSQNNILVSVSYGLKQIGNLEIQRQQAIIAAQQAMQEGDYKIVTAMHDKADAIQKDQQAEFNKIQDNLIKANEKAIETKAQIQKDNAIVNLFSPTTGSGISDPIAIFKKLQENGFKDIPLQEVTDKVALLSGQGGTGQVGEYNMYKADTQRKGLTPLDYMAWKDQQDAKQAKLDSAKAYNNAYASAAGKAAGEATSGTDTTQTTIDSTSQSIMAQTGLSAGAFAYATQGSAGLTRMNSADRTKYMNEWKDYQIKHNIDGATSKAQFDAYSNTVKANIMRNNQATVASDELMGTITNIRSAATEAGLGDLKGLNIANIWAGSQLNSASQETFKIHLTQLRNELAMYNAATAGQLDANGNIRENSKADMENIADTIIQNGFAAGSIDGFEKAIKSSKDKLGAVLEKSISAQNKQVWNMFGVGANYKEPISPERAKNEVDTYIKTNPNNAETIAKLYEVPGATDQDIYDYLKANGLIQ